MALALVMCRWLLLLLTIASADVDVVLPGIVCLDRVQHLLPGSFVLVNVFKIVLQIPSHLQQPARVTTRFRPSGALRISLISGLNMFTFR